MMRTKRYIGIEIRALDNQIKRLIDSKIQKSAFCRLTGSNGWIIDYIRKKSPKPVYQKDLEAEFNITRSTASKVLNLMEEKGFIVRESVPEDARLKKLVLTPEAIEISKGMEADRDAIERQITKGFSEKELEQFYSYIERIRKNVSEI
ncbi:MarR family transcriptional regulator [Eubacterium sp. am_0171]|nr:MarR family transcriptional regulator [Faecalicatena contorta]MSC85805.1 MarR family transcriptional regulator [Eubacterium sp. BIOML-A1]MSD07136.1 MarR family transcriptional regulator [Eubacterium sp. BIOML-A2]RYT16258.1 MarR family transcriptional regulator [Eubacterium sp. am_0171]